MPRLIVLLVVMVVELSSAPARGQELATIAGTTVLRAETSAMARVTIPQDARLRIAQGDNPDLEITGGQRFGGVYLRRLSAPLNDPQLFVAWQDEPCTLSLCDERLLDIGLPTTPDSGSLVLPAGDYELALILDRGPLRASLRFAGLDGSATISLEDKVDTTVTSTTQTGSLLVSDSASRNITVGSPYGVEIDEYSLRGAAPGGVVFETCADAVCSRGAGTYTQGDVEDGPYGIAFTGPASYTHTVRATGVLAAPWNARFTTAAVTFSSARLPGQASSITPPAGRNIPDAPVARRTLEGNR